ncbi:MAG: hypothetical protein HUJ25_06485 [Crocinitomicaceae bacterium]|nr:hypothetical protein [Crocinitomicaceae bacterium]
MIRSWMMIFCVVSTWSFAQSEHDGNRLYDHDLDEEKWEEIRNDIRYEGSEDGPGRQWTYESNEDYNRARRDRPKTENGNGGNGGDGEFGPGDGASKKPRSSSSRRRRSSGGGGGFAGLGIFGYVLLAVFLVGLILLIYYLFVNAPRKGKKVGDPIALEEINPTEIPLTELQRLLQEALSKGDYRGAVRIYFIFIIRDLAEKKWIRWEKEKTNFHYLREMAGKPEYDEFNRSVSFFEIIWYGKREVDKQKFEEIKPNFTRLLDRLGVK